MCHDETQGASPVPTKLFILGRPGSGKSTAAIWIQALAIERGCSCIHINDYAILNVLFENDKLQNKKNPRFRAVGNGFDILDSKVFDVVLRMVRKRAMACVDSSKYDLVIIEFARDNYQRDLQRFDDNFLRDAYFLFLDVDLDTCIERINLRALNPRSINDRYISEDMLRKYYSNDDRFYIMNGLADDYKLDSNQFRIIHNHLQLVGFQAELINFAEFLIDRSLKNTEPVRSFPLLQVEVNNDVAK
jgi:adenylate kinase family enzyme